MLRPYKTTLLFVIISCITSSLFAQPNRINIAEKPLFVNGANVAWINFARDIGPGETNFGLFEEMFQEMNENGGNSFRLWLHTNGVSTPQFTGTGPNDTVIGPGVGAIQDLRQILDLAHEYDISLKLCLWSFDMLQSGLSTDVLQRNRALLTDDAKMDAYIQNSLIPMVDSLKGHPAILAWEIFNEPEGMTTNFGWTPAGFRVSMSHIQTFVNRTVGAIKRTDPDVLVTNGSWSFRASSDKNLRGVVYTNFYRDDRLISAGGDSLGVLDFYSVHYYEHFSTPLSPFHFDASYWGLDKPIVIGEFYLTDPRVDGNPDATFNVPWQDLYKTLYNRGYAGAMGWQWFDWYAERTDMDGVDGTLNWPRMLTSMKALSEEHPEDTILEFPGLRLKFESQDSQIEKGQSTWLKWETRGADRVTLNDANVSFVDSLEVSPTETTIYTLSALDETDSNDTLIESITVTVVEPMTVNRVLNRPVFSSPESSNPTRVNDGNMTTYWSPDSDGTISVWFDMQQTVDFEKFTANWGNIRPSQVSVSGSYDGFTWFTIQNDIPISSSLTESTVSDPTKTRFIRFFFENDGDNPVRIAEISAYGVISDNQIPMVSVASSIWDDYLESGNDVFLLVDVIAGHEVIESVEYFVNDVLVATTTESPFDFLWEIIPVGDHEIYARAETATYSLQTPSVFMTVHPMVQSLRLEAENSAIAGNTTIQEHSSASHGRYIRMEAASGSSLTWNDIQIAEGGDFTLRIGFRLPFDTPKGQFLFVNGAQISEIMFAGEINQWLFEDIPISLISGSNSIVITGSWGYMDLDFVEVRGNGITTSTESNELVTRFSLEQNYPNPFNPTTTIQFSLPNEGHTKLTVFDVLGREVAVLVDDLMTVGSHTLSFDAGSQLASGVYLYRLQSGGLTSTQKMLLMK